MIVVKAVSRPLSGWELLSDLQDQIDAERPRCRRVVVGDHCDPPSRPGWRLVVHRGDVGSRAAGWAALALGADLPFLLHLEDDTKLATGGLGVMLGQEIPADTDFVSFFFPRAPLNRQGGLKKRPLREFRFSQAVKFPRRTISALLAAGPSGYPIVPAGTPHGFDQAVRHALGNAGSYGLLWPNVVEHRGRGRDSSIEYHRGRTLGSGWFSG